MTHGLDILKRFTFKAISEDKKNKRNRRERERERERERMSIGILGCIEDLLQMYDTGLQRANKFFTMNELITCHIINKEMAKMIRIRHTYTHTQTLQPGSSPTFISYCVDFSWIRISF